MPGSSSPGMTPRQPLPKQLTAAIKACASLERLAQLCQAYQAVLNPIHIAAIITKLPKLDVTQDPTLAASPDMAWMLPASAQQQQLSQLLQELLSRLKAQGCSGHSPRGVANILWALAKLQCAPDAELRGLLLDRFCEELSSAVPQDISNLLWGVAKLTKEHAPVLSSAAGSTQQQPQQQQSQRPGSPPGTVGSVPSSPAASLPPGSADLGAQDQGSGALAATAGAAGPLLQQDQVRLLLQQLCKQLPSASVQTISNSLWAVVVLQQQHQWCMCSCLTEVQTLLTVFCEQPQQAMPGHIQPVVR